MFLTEKINREIVKALADLENAIDIIEQAKNTGTAIAAKDSKLIDELELMHSKELIALMLESKIRKRNAKAAYNKEDEKRYQPFLISDKKSLDDFISYLAGLPKEEQYYFDFILRPKDSHSSAMQVYSNGITPKSFYLESAIDINRKFREQINNAINAEEHNYVAGKILNADYGCTIFTIQNLNAMRRLFYEGNYLEESSQVEDLNPVFIKNAQSIKLLKNYSEQNKDKPLYINKRKTISLAEQIENFAVSTEIISGSESVIKKRNYASLYKTKKYLLSTLELLYSLNNDEKQLDEILYNRSVNPIIYSVYNQMGLNEHEKNYVEGLFNQEQIKLSLKYQIPSEFFKDSICFKNIDNSKFIYQYIENYAGIDSNKAKNILSLIEKCSNIHQLRLILEENINPEQVYHIEELNDSKIAPFLSDFIKNCKVLYGEKGVNAAFVTLNTTKLNIDNAAALNCLNINQLLSFAIFSQNVSSLRAWIKAGADINNPTSNAIENAVNTRNFNIIGEVILAGAKITPVQISQLKENYQPGMFLKHFKKAIDQENIKAITNFLNIDPQLVKSNINNVNIMEYIEINNKTKIIKALASINNADFVQKPDYTPFNKKALGKGVHN